MFSYVFFAVFLVGFVEGQTIGLGPCPAVTVKQGLNLAQYAGKWYEAEKFNNFFQGNGRCVTAQYTVNGTVVIVENKQTDNTTGKEVSISGTARFANPNSTEGKLIVNFPSAPFGSNSPYWVLDTDYTYYSVVYSCVNLFFINIKFLWILTRPRFFVDLNAPYAVLDAKKIDRTALVRTDNFNCGLFF